MAKGLNQVKVNLLFSADTGQAKAQLQDLKNQLNSLMTAAGSTGSKLPLTNQVIEATNAASQLKAALDQATNVNTGRLDLSKFNQSLKASGMSLKQYAAQLNTLGPQGQKAFLSVAQSIVTAETPMRRTNELAREMFNTLKNTARWQLSSSILHGFMGAVQEAYGYAQDLNKSLNNIRIVTGKGVDEMKEFAEYANKAAKSLNVSTTEFTDAALIFYQQGLSGDAVMERAAVVSKMANVSGQSAQVVSDQMTAVWNNFNDGSKSLEYYADVMTALGAATASSTDEIAQGLEKFAAIADTVGLSYEYATSALATVTAETRQSADVVGTAFKTIFARLEGLSLGDTLEDGTDLNKYSAALKTVGVEIKDASGEMRSMDSILNDLGNRWGDLAQDEKIALAQTVAGVRQYNQLISLMDNWGTFQENLTTAKTSSGSLDVQADIYAESWEAAQQRVKTSAEEIYSQLLDDDFFIKLSNMLADLIQSFGKFTKAVGGLPGLLGVIGTLGTQIFKKELAEGIDNLAYNFKVRTGVIKKETEVLKDQAVQALEELKSRKGMSASEVMEIELTQDQLKYSRELQEISENISEEQRSHLSTLIDVTKQYGEMAIAAQKAAEAAKEKVEKTDEDLNAVYVNKEIEAVKGSEDYEKADGWKKKEMLHSAAARGAATGLAAQKQAENIATFDSKFEEIESGDISADMFDTLSEDTKQAGRSQIYRKEEMEHLHEIRKKLQDHIDQLKELEEKRKKLEEELASGFSTPERKAQIEKELAENEQKQEDIKGSAKKVRDDYLSSDKGKAGVAKRKAGTQATIMDKSGGDEKVAKAMEKSINSRKEQIKLEKKAAKANKDAIKQNKNLAKSFTNLSKKVTSFGKKFTSVANTVSMLTMGLSSLKSALDSLSDPDMSPLEKLSSLAMSIGMVIPGLVKVFGALTGAISRNNSIVGINSTLLANNGKAISQATALKIAETLANEELTEEQQEEAITKLLLTQMTQKEVDAIKEKTKTTLVETFTNKANTKSEESGIIVRMKSIVATLKQTAANGTGIVAKLADAAANVIATMTAWPLAIVILVIVAAIIALVAIVLVVVAVFQKWKAAMPTEQLKKANEELKRTSEEMEKAKEASEKLKESIKGYEDAVDSLHGLTKGTEEYNEALKKANDAARELINNNPELAGKYSFNAETGLIEFDDNALDDMQELQDKRYTSALADQTHAQNEVLQAKNYGAAFDASGSWGTPEGLGIALTMLTGGIGGLLLEAKTMSDNAQQDAINNLAENMNKYNGNFEKARNSLSASDQALIDSLGMTDSELSALAQEMANNTQAILENNKILIGQALQDNELYQRFADEEGYTDLIAGQFQKDVDAEVESGETSKLKGKKLEEEYAKLKGYTRTGSGTFTDSEGNEIKDISDESMRVAIANDKVLNNIDSNIGNYNKDYANFKSREKQLSANINSAEDFEAYKEQMMKEFGDKYGTAAVESYIAQSTSKVGTDGKTIADYNNRDRLVSSMSGINISEEAKNKIADELFNGDYTEEQIEAAIAGAAESDSVTDLQRNIALGLVEGSVQGLEKSVEQVKGIMDEASKAGNFTTEQLNQITANEDFKQFLEDQGKDLQDFMHDSFGDQYNLMQDFYQQSNEQLYEALDAQQEIYINSIEEVYAAAANGTMAIEDAVYEVERLLNKVDEVNNKRIEMAMDWSDVDQAVKGFDNLSKLNKAMLSDTYKLGNSYQLTAKQAREWVEVYPELMDQATLTADGIYQLDESVVKNYIAQQEAETKADIKRQKEKLQMQRNDLQTQLESLKAEQQMWAQTKTGEVKIEALSKEQLIRLRSNYTQYFIEAGMTEAEASNAALKAMGMSQEQYYSAVTGMAAQSGNKIIEFFKDVVEKVMNFINSIIAAIDSWDGETEIEVDLSLNTNIDDSIDGFYDEGGMLDQINKDLEDQIQNTEEAIKEIDRQMKYLDAVYNGGLTGWMTEDLSSQDKNKLKRELDKEIERYHVINQQIERQEKALSRLGKAKDKAYGPAKLKYMQQEIGMLEDMASMEEQRLAQMKDGLAFDQGIMLGHGAQLDENGVILNYDQLIMEKLQAKQQAQLSGNEADIEAAEQAYDDFMEDLERYEETLSSYEDQLEAVQDAQDAILTAKLETIQYEVEYKIDIVSDDLEYLDYLLGKIEDDAFAAAQKIALLTDETNALIEQGEAYQKGIDDLFAAHNVNPEDLATMSLEDFEAAGFTEADLEQLREYQAGLMETAQAIQDKKDQVEESLNELYDGWNERIESQIAKIEHAQSVLENYRNIVDTVGKGVFGFDTETMLKLTRKQVEAANANTRAIKAQYDANVEAMNTAKEALANAQAEAAKDPENQALQDDVKYWEEQVQKTSEKVDELELSYKEALVNSLSLVAEEYKQAIDAAVEYFNEAVSKNGKSLSELQESYGRSQEVDDRYIDGYEKMYELNKMSRDLDKKLAKSNSVAEQQALIKMLEKINAYKEEGVEMSEYELKALQAEVELEQAKIAMEEAQNAKTQVVRRRDSEGNWGYVYTADADKSADAIATYEEKLYNAEKTTDEFLDSVGEKILQAQEAMATAIAEIMADTNLSAEEQAAKIAEVQEHYTGQINYYYDQMGIALENNRELLAEEVLYRTDWNATNVDIDREMFANLATIRQSDYESKEEYYKAIEELTGLNREEILALEEQGVLDHANAVGQKIASDLELQDSFTDTKYAQATEYDDMKEAQDDFLEATETLVDSTGVAYENYKTAVDESMQAAGTSTEEFVENFEEDTDQVASDAEKAADAVEDMAEDMATDYAEAAGDVQDFQIKFAGYMKQIEDSIENTKIVIDSLITRLKELDAKYQESQQIASQPITYTTNGGSGGGGGNGGSGGGGGDSGGGNDNKPITYKEVKTYPTKSVTQWCVGGWDENLKLGTGYAIKLDGKDCVYIREYDGYVATSDIRWDKPFSSDNKSYTKDLHDKYGSKDQWMVKQGATVYTGDVKTEKVAQYDTGGYTGKWGSEGRMAMLHEKEIILNAKDTENFLLATSVLRDIVSKIELNSLGNLLSTSLSANNLQGNTNNGIEQNVVIHAEFPDATNHNEIEEAFNNLILRASQYANRK